VPITPYASRTELKARLTSTVTTWDDAIDQALDSASREIDKYCNRRFYLDSVASARVYYPDNCDRVTVDDFYDTASLVVKTDSGNDGTFETTWTLNTDYILDPLNGVVDGESGWPYRQILAIGSLSFPVAYWVRQRPPVQVTAKWGWAAIPAPVKEACLILATANFSRKDVKFDVAGFDGIGAMRAGDDRAVAKKLNPYRRNPVLVA
jgi:hypothetical protein